MHDVMPPESEVWQFIEKKAHDLFKRFGFGEIRMPILEETQLFSRSIGEVTDIVEKEMYTFEDRKGKSLTLRPEGTASVVRAVIEKGSLGKSGQDNPILRLYYLGPMFRYERPQKGRQRQFYQMGAEVFGSDLPQLDAEVLAFCWLFLQELQLDSWVSLEINSLGDGNTRKKYAQNLKEYFGKIIEDLPEEVRHRLDRNPMRVLDSKDPKMQDWIQNAPTIRAVLDEDSHKHFESVCKHLDLLKIPYKINERIVRGLDYYSKTTFEFTTQELGAQGAVIAGGRYDGLVEELGGNPTPAIGFAAGIERLAMLVQKCPQTPAGEANPQVFIIGLGKESRDLCFQILHDLRRDGVSSQMDFREKSLKAALRQADRLNSAFVVLMGEDELKKKQVVLKNMVQGSQEEFSFLTPAEIAPLVRNRIQR
jgi:histidyl-tRNA synthetase